MRTSLRFLGLSVLLVSSSFRAFAAPSALPAQAATPPLALPAFVDVVTFTVNFEDDNRKLITTTAPNVFRLDSPDESYSLIYNPQTENYTGLENRNDTYWVFSWPEVRDAVQTSKRYESHLQDLSNEGLSADVAAPPTTNAPDATQVTTSVSGSGPGDDSGYVWRPTEDKKNIAGLDTAEWTGDTVSGGHVVAWCYAAPLPKVTAAVAQLRAINEPMSLVPVRPVVPDFIFPIYDSLTKAGVTPVLITWGDAQRPNRFQLDEVSTRPAKVSMFTVPKIYVKTTLVTMDGIIDQPKK